MKYRAFFTDNFSHSDFGVSDRETGAEVEFNRLEDVYTFALLLHFKVNSLENLFKKLSKREDFEDLLKLSPKDLYHKVAILNTGEPILYFLEDEVGGVLEDPFDIRGKNREGYTFDGVDSFGYWNICKIKGIKYKIIREFICINLDLFDTDDEDFFEEEEDYFPL